MYKPGTVGLAAVSFPGLHTFVFPHVVTSIPHTCREPFPQVCARIRKQARPPAWNFPSAPLPIPGRTLERERDTRWTKAVSTRGTGRYGTPSKPPADRSAITSSLLFGGVRSDARGRLADTQLRLNIFLQNYDHSFRFALPKRIKKGRDFLRLLLCVPGLSPRFIGFE